MMRLWERALRRAELPIRLSEGYNPRPRMSLPEPRSVGIASDAEIFEFELADWVNPDVVLERLRRELPEGLEAERLELMRPREKARPEAVIYVARPPDPPPDLAARAERVLAMDTAPVVRRRPRGDKHLDARAFLETIEVPDEGTVRMVLATGPGGTVRPDEILGLMGFDDETIARTPIRRTEIRLG